MRQFTPQIQPKQLISQFVSRIKFRGSRERGERGKWERRWVAHNIQRDQCGGISVPGNFASRYGLRLGRPRHADQRIRWGEHSTRSSVSRGADKHPKPENRFSFLPAPLGKCRANLLNGSRVYLEALSSGRHSIHFSEAYSRLSRE